MDEDGLFYCLTPNNTFGSQKIQGGKKAKIQTTVALICNSDGPEKPILLFLGHANNPRRFQKESGNELGF